VDGGGGGGGIWGEKGINRLLLGDKATKQRVGIFCEKRTERDEKGLPGVQNDNGDYGMKMGRKLGRLKGQPLEYPTSPLRNAKGGRRKGGEQTSTHGGCGICWPKGRSMSNASSRRKEFGRGGQMQIQ